MLRRRNPLKSNEELVQQLIGRWKIEMAYCKSDSDGSDSSEGESDSNDKTGLMGLAEELQGVEFTLDEQYDLTWHLPHGMERNSLFHANAYDVDRSEIELMGAADGQSYIFRFNVIDDTVELICPANPHAELVIVVKKVTEGCGGNFSLLNALHQGFFSDLNIRSVDGQQFSAHRVILGVTCTGVRYREWEVLLSSVSSSALKAALHYMYTSSLPCDISDDVAKELSELASKNGKLTHLKELCLAYIDNYTLKKRLQDIVDSLIHSFDVCRQMIESTEMNDPAKISYAIKQLAKEVAIGISRFALLCQLYTKNKQDMTLREKKEVLEYVQARVVVCLDNGRELLQLILAKWTSLTDIQKQEIAAYIIPEVERIWDLLNTHANELHGAVGDLDKKEKVGIIHGRGLHWKISAALQFNSRLKEVRRLKKFNKEFNDFVRVGGAKRQWFIELNEEEKVSWILRVIREAIQDAEELIQKLEDIKKKILLANALDWSSYKLTVSLTCSYVSWALNKLLSLKGSIKPAVTSLCHFIGQNDVNMTLIHLGLLDPSDVIDDSQPPAIPPLPGLGKYIPEHCNLLSESCVRLLETHEMSDMQLVLVDPQTHNTSDSVHPFTDEGTKESSIVIPAHRVILAARSEWFQRALQSGMKEDRDRRIVVQDIEESLFRTFLEYLYGKTFDFDKMSIQELVELLAVADRFETSSLRLLCESQLVAKIQDKTVFQLLVAADQFSATQLREHSLHHILNNPDVIMTDVDGYSDLPSEIKQEVRQLLSGTQDPMQFGPRRPKTEPDTLALLNEMVPELKLLEEHPHGYTHVDLDSEDKVLHLQDNWSIGDDNTALQSAIEQLRLIVGDDPSDEILKNIALAADLDVNRALNYYFGTQEP